MERSKGTIGKLVSIKSDISLNGQNAVSLGEAGNGRIGVLLENCRQISVKHESFSSETVPRGDQCRFPRGMYGELRSADLRSSSDREPVISLGSLGTERIAVQTLAGKIMVVKCETFFPLITTQKCPECGKDAPFLCTACRREWYCSKLCQDNHWRYHKTCCGMPIERLEDKRVIDSVQMGQLVSYDIGKLITDLLIHSIRLTSDSQAAHHSVFAIQISFLSLSGITGHRLLAAHGNSDILKFIDKMQAENVLDVGGSAVQQITSYINRRNNLPSFILILLIERLSICTRSSEDCRIHFQHLTPDPRLAPSHLLVLRRSKLPSGNFKRVNIIPTMNMKGIISKKLLMCFTGLQVPDSEIYQKVRVGVQCAVCFSENISFITLSCKHDICDTCAVEWLENKKRESTCPICRSPWNNSVLKANLGNYRTLYRTRCCMCGALCEYRCRCHSFDYCSKQCANQHNHDCEHRWFLAPEEYSANTNTIWKWDDENHKFVLCNKQSSIE